MAWSLKTSWLKQATKLTDEQWVKYVQRRIAARSRPSKDPDHDQTDTQAWLLDLVKRVERQMGKGPGDENMGIAARLSLILALWYSRIQLAKAHDPRRPLKLRRWAYQSWRVWALAMADAIHDQSADPAYFPDQHFDPPHSPHAIDGTFV